MAKATAKPKPAAKPAPKPTPSSSGKAAQAAAHQGRPAPTTQPKPAPRPSVPATVRTAAPPATGEELRNVPAFMQEYTDAGKEAISNEDIVVPRLKLMQALSPEIQAYNGLQAGNFFHVAAEEIIESPFRAVPIFINKQYILWNPRNSGGGILARANDAVHWSPNRGEFEVKLDNPYTGQKAVWKLAPTVAQSGLANWGTMQPADNNSPPAATLMYNLVLAFPDRPDLMPAVLTFQRSSIKAGRQLLTKLKTVRTPIFGTIFNFEAVEATNKSGQDYFNMQATGAGIVEDEGQFMNFRDMHETFRQQGFDIKDIEEMQEEGSGADEGSSGAERTTDY